jgi:hypothetical protein
MRLTDEYEPIVLLNDGEALAGGHGPLVTLCAAGCPDDFGEKSPEKRESSPCSRAAEPGTLTGHLLNGT